jgi:hypothetical protein
MTGKGVSEALIVLWVRLKESSNSIYEVSETNLAQTFETTALYYNALCSRY